VVDSGARTEVSQHPGQGERHPGDLLAPTLPGGEPIEKLLRGVQFFAPGKPSPDHREVHRKGGREAEEFWHERWRHDKVVRSTHGVNCTGSCSWKVYVKDGIITWETQQRSTIRVGGVIPEYSPRLSPWCVVLLVHLFAVRVRYPTAARCLISGGRPGRSGGRQ
jgi:nitrate reductase alpha subunit